MSRLGLIVAAGGYGLRLGAGGPKQYVLLAGRPMLQWTVATLAGCAAVDTVVVVVNPEDVEFCREEVVGAVRPAVAAVVGGGPERALSVRNGLRALMESGSVDLVGTHDGARPLVTCAQVAALRGRLESDPTLAGAILAVPSTDTVKLVDGHGVIEGTPVRGTLWRAQTPQLFRTEVFEAAYAQAPEVVARATDDATLVEALGGRVAVVEGSPDNLKVTTPLDIRLAELLLQERAG